MIKHVSVLAFLLLPVLGFSALRKSAPSVWIIQDNASAKVHQDSIRLVFKVFDRSNALLLNQHPAIIQVKVDGKTKKYTVSDKNRTFNFTLPKGKHHFSFFVNANFEEIRFNPELKGGHHVEAGLNFEARITPGEEPAQIMLEKPVVYLYSETKREFSLKINTPAEIQFSYPVYGNEWKGTSSPDGTIQINGSNYPYLFWDAQLPAEKLNLNWHHSEQILGEQTIQYLSARLDDLGFNPKEKADFITYWGPRMQQMNYLQVLWIQNERLHDIASLDISPDYTQNRIYIVFREISDLLDETLELKPNKLQPISRSKNCLVEWGGMEMTQTDF